ncbi:complement component receptor 1-like protein isoform X2 [Tachysurus fulvidraco]|uniref:complement component receptor 1-like protein isoform X2 n=1 Tax=Tachysurus fulvidraco TaxID=1234273 RepID=UPI001FF015D4|nr:complement component receptor 1-like protein isoform X2 [Tachysurus fulvidraco]
MLCYIIIPILLTMAVKVRAQCDEPVVGGNRIMTEGSQQGPFPEGTSIKFKCSTGYIPVSRAVSSSVTCNGNQWSELELQCKKKSCGNPGEIPYGKYVYQAEEAVLFGAVITAVCNKGYQLVGYDIRTCRANGWDGRPPDCEVVKCQPPPDVKDGTFEPVEDQYAYEEGVSYSCKRGLDLIGSSILTCSDKGHFQPNPPQCLLVTCDRPDIPNAVRIEGKSPPYKYSEFVRYQCNKGFKMEGADRMVCTEKGWDPPPPQCTVITCVNPPDLTNGHFTPKKELYEYEQKVTYSCDEGFELKGTSSILCTLQGTFEPLLSQCLVITCDPPFIDHGVVNVSLPSYKYNDQVHISCNEGFKIDGSSILTCKDHVWSPSLPRCIELTCSAPEILNAFIFKGKASFYKYKSFIQVQCNKGYKMEGSSYLTCEENGWNSPLPKCTIVTCSEPPSINQGQVIQPKQSYEYGQKVTYLCNVGFRLDGDQTRSCTEYGKFQDPPRCLVITCDPPFIDHGVVNVSLPSYKYNDQVHISCNEGFKIDGSSILTCKDHVWSPSLPRCIELTCSAPEILNAFIFKGKASFYKYKSFIQVQCNKGYKMEGSSYLTCEENGWDSPLPKCTIVTCSEPPSINQGQVIQPKQSYEYGQKVTYLCNIGFHLDGDQTRSCTEYGKFQDPPRCLDITCGAPHITNGFVTGHILITYPYKSKVRVKCNRFYKMEGSDFLTCEENGWNPPSPKCHFNHVVWIIPIILIALVPCVVFCYTKCSKLKGSTPVLLDDGTEDRML